MPKAANFLVSIGLKVRLDAPEMRVDSSHDSTAGFGDHQSHVTWAFPMGIAFVAEVASLQLLPPSGRYHISLRQVSITSVHELG